MARCFFINLGVFTNCSLSLQNALLGAIAAGSLFLGKLKRQESVSFSFSC
jgi:hypothetical protein